MNRTLLCPSAQKLQFGFNAQMGGNSSKQSETVHFAGVDEFAGYGRFSSINDLPSQAAPLEVAVDPLTLLDTDASPAPHEKIMDGTTSAEPLKPMYEPRVHVKLGQLLATAIAGNDITSNVLYVVGISAQYSGMYTPVALFLVALILYLFRSIYSEVGAALPMNGGCYTLLLNTTSKNAASLAACFSMLSYLATTVVSGQEAMSYLQNMWPAMPLFWATVILLALFAFLNILGITESAVVAAVMFLHHMLVMVVLVVSSTIRFASDPGQISLNWSCFVGDSSPAYCGNSTNPIAPSNAASAIYFGFATAMLGLTGFETSANFIEEQAPGVFPLTLRNMWVIVLFLNPLMSLLAIATVPLKNIGGNSALLATMANDRPWLELWVSIDGVLVLSGAVLTGYVGITGLIRRMALDRCLPQFLLHQNKLRRTNHWIIIIFFLICFALLAIVNGNINILAGVYTIAFLGVMSLFAIGNMMLKYKRARLPRDIRARWLTVVVALAAVAAALVGNIVIDPQTISTFAIFFLFTALAVAGMLSRHRLVKLLLYFVMYLVPKSKKEAVQLRFQSWLVGLQDQQFVFLAKDDSLPVLTKAVLYVRDNEQTRVLNIVHIFKDESEIPANLQPNVEFLDQCFPKIRLDLILVKGEFTPQVIEGLSERLKIPKNCMFITCPSDKFSQRLGDLGGVRLISH
eukprot:TRINITY_DN4134_c0_g3_i1.p1 TRINITY_DN4134_c0_g3~~TRINITY_DN4134_c0_g3_i1.p1  ORF type:complete len:687 (-),score=130.05 TRINITY_DN4134_c0_g3_i1:2978-5038(-)